ncbi:MAG: hypothetical protein V4487_00815 [Chlamydiota bacterium]
MALKSFQMIRATQTLSPFLDLHHQFLILPFRQVILNLLAPNPTREAVQAIILILIWVYFPLQGKKLPLKQQSASSRKTNLHLAASRRIVRCRIPPLRNLHILINLLLLIKHRINPHQYFQVI